MICFNVILVCYFTTNPFARLFPNLQLPCIAYYKPVWQYVKAIHVLLHEKRDITNTLFVAVLLLSDLKFVCFIFQPSLYIDKTERRIYMQIDYDIDGNEMKVANLLLYNEVSNFLFLIDIYTWKILNSNNL